MWSVASCSLDLRMGQCWEWSTCPGAGEPAMDPMEWDGCSILKRPFLKTLLICARWPQERGTTSNQGLREVIRSSRGVVAHIKETVGERSPAVWTLKSPQHYLMEKKSAFGIGSTNDRYHLNQWNKEIFAPYLLSFKSNSQETKCRWVNGKYKVEEQDE